MNIQTSKSTTHKEYNPKLEENSKENNFKLRKDSVACHFLAKFKQDSMKITRKSLIKINKYKQIKEKKNCIWT